IDGAAQLAEAQGIVSAALQPFASEPLVWEAGRTFARLRREGRDPTTTRRVLAIEQTLGAAVAIREAFAGRDAIITRACDVEPADADANRHEYWVRRQRLDRLLERAGGETLCRREVIAARALALSQLGVHLEEEGDGAALRLVTGRATALTWE